MASSPGTSQPWFKKEDKQATPGYGTFIGAFIPCILKVFGVIIFLRLGWIVGQAGLSTSLTIISSAAFIVLITTLSMAAISTNISVGKGGVYYILSRSLGIEVGAAIGIPLYLKQALSIAFCVIGFAESVHDLVPAWSITAIGITTLVALTLLAYFSLSKALKVQVGIFAIIIISLISLFMGGDPKTIPEEVFSPDVPRNLSFWAIFAIFFPAMTGVESSVSLSGNLRNPARSLPLGTLSALLVAYVIYMLIPIFLVKHVSLNLLATDPMIMQAVAKFPALIVLGMWGSTISSSLIGLLGAPRTLQALAEDRVVPKFFGKTFGTTGEPRIATLVTCAIAFMGIYFGSVNNLAPLLSMICLICYGVLNFSAGLETLMSNPSWRPRFRVHWSISIFGALACFVAMIMIDAGSAILAIALILTIYTIIKRRQLSTSWEDIRHGMLLFFSRFAIYRLAHTEVSTKSWRPHFLVFSDVANSNLLHFAHTISRSKGFITVASFLSPEKTTVANEIEYKKSLEEDLKRLKIPALVQVGKSKTPTLGMQRLIENYGLGPLTPNMILCGSTHENDSLHLAQAIYNSTERHHNFVIFHDNLPEVNFFNQANGDIHIWWDALSKANSELMLVLAYMLKQNPKWKKSKICLKAVVESEVLKEQAHLEFKALSQKTRLAFDTQILVSLQPRSEMPELLLTFSKKAGIVFAGLDSPSSPDSLEEYAIYLKSLSEFSPDLPAIAFVLSSQQTPLEHILE